MDRYIQIALVATRQAMDQAGLPARLEGDLAERTGVILATGLGGVQTLFENVETFVERGPDRISPFMIPMGIPNMAAGQIPMSSAAGPQLRDRLGVRQQRPRPGRGVRGHSPRRRGPDDRGRLGGAAARGARRRVLRDEGAEHAQRRPGRSVPAVRPRPRWLRDRRRRRRGGPRSARQRAGAGRGDPRGELAGYAATADGYHLTLPAPGGSGAVRAARRALEKAGLAPGAIDHVNAHATSTPEGDPDRAAGHRDPGRRHAAGASR